jgi:predicted ATP-grasp superfamily ATP-dependent carboligase
LIESVLTVLERNNIEFGDFILQEFISAPGYGVSALFNHGEMKAKFTHRRLRERSPKGGPSTLRESINLPILEEYAERLLRHVGHHGVAMVEFKYDAATGKVWFLEVNPRWWGSLALATQSGVDFPVLIHQMIHEEISSPQPEYRTGVKVRWLLGDLLAIRNQFLAGQMPRLNSFWPAVNGYDDAYANDLRPLAAEFFLFFRKRLRWRKEESIRTRSSRPSHTTVPSA